MRKLLRHRDSVRQKVLRQSLHQGAEAEVGVRLVVHGDQQRAQQVGHALKQKMLDLRSGHNGSHLFLKLELCGVVLKLF